MKILCHPIIILCAAGNFGRAGDGVFQWRTRAESSGTRLYCWCLLFKSHGWVGLFVSLHSFLSMFLSREYSNLNASFHKGCILGSVKHVWHLVLAKLLMGKKLHGSIYRYICIYIYMKHEAINQNLYSEHKKFHTETCVFTATEAHIQCTHQRERRADRERERVCVCMCVWCFYSIFMPVTSVFLAVCVFWVKGCGGGRQCFCSRFTLSQVMLLLLPMFCVQWWAVCAQTTAPMTTRWAAAAHRLSLCFVS